MELFFFRQNRPGKCLLRYSRTNKGFSRIWKQEVAKVEKLPFFQGVNPWFWYKNGHFSNFFFLSKIGQENVFYDILKRIKAFLGYENKKLKKSKNWRFSKRVNPWFWYQNGYFLNFFFLAKIGRKNVFYDILERIKAFPGYENKKLKQSKNCHFS